MLYEVITAVIGQMPEAGHDVKEGRTIFLSICALSPEQVEMPKLTDISFRQAVNIMQTVGLNVGRIEYVPSEFSNLVLAQKLNEESVEPGVMVNNRITSYNVCYTKLLRFGIVSHF